MSIVPLLLLCSLVLVAGSLVLFVWSCKQGDCHESDRLCLLPLEDDVPVARPELPTPVIPQSSEIEGTRHA
jgi:nitrogen fixation-related uncharacterized protein